jgi:hypothetical protein
MWMILVPHRKHDYWPPQPVTGIALLVYMWMIFVPHRKHGYWPPQPVAAIALLVYMWMIFVPHRKHGYWPPQPVAAIALTTGLLVCVWYLHRADLIVLLLHFLSASHFW